MSIPVKRIQPVTCFEKQFSFCTLVTRFAEYTEMVESAIQAGFDEDETEYLYFDNTSGNSADGYHGINRALREAKGKYLIFCHQDVLFIHDRRQQLEHCLGLLEQHDPHWAVAGNAGKTRSGLLRLRISDPHGQDIKMGQLPAEVISLDENFLVINRNQNIACTAALSGFHLYGTDLCQNANRLGLKNYVIDFHLFHKSAGKVDAGYFEVQRRYVQWQSQQKRGHFIWAMCSSFFVSSWPGLNRMFSWKLFIKIARTLSKFNAAK